MQELLPGSVLLVKYIPSDEDGSDYENSDEDMDEDMDEDSDVESGPCMAPDGSVLTECSCFYPYGMLHLRALATLEPATIAQHADGVVAMLAADDRMEVREAALDTLAKLEPVTLAQHAHAVVKLLLDDPVENDTAFPVLNAALAALKTFPLVVTRDLDFDRIGFYDNYSYFDAHNIPARLLGRIAWYRCRLRLRVRRIALYWYALPYRPSGPGHARDVEAWALMSVQSS